MKKLLCILALTLGSAPVHAQQTPVDTTAELPMAWVWGARQDAFGQGSRQWNSKGRPFFSTLSELLPQSAPVYIKSYGPGQLSSLSLRGAGAAHTALIWNGFNLQNPMHGQVDFSLVPAPLFSDVRIDLGANSALWGSGTIGGAIHLDSEGPDWGSGHRLIAGAQAAQFGQQTLQTAYSWGGRDFTSQTRVFYRNQENDFPLTDLSGNNALQMHASFQQWGFTQDWVVRQGTHQFDAHIWVQGSDRQIPPTLLQSTSEATQADQNIRTALHWQWVQRDWIFHLRSAWISDFIHYADSAIDLDDKSRSQVLYAEGETQWTPRRGHLLSLGLHQALLYGETDYYPELPGQSRTALMGSYRLESEQAKWSATASIRQEWTPDQWAPFSPTVSGTWTPLPGLQTKVQASRHFRWPTLNDRFWSPGGNPDLNPEKGWGAECGISAKSQNGKPSLEGELSAYTRQISNWILWRPDGAFWSPQNLALVWSRGAEAEVRLRHLWGPVQMDYQLAYAWVRSTSEKSLGPNDDSYQKQLTYTPEHAVVANAAAKWRSLSLSWRQRYMGKVYTLSDHSEELPGYFISDLHLEAWFNCKDLNILFFSDLNNIFNVDYQVVQHRPMPGRWLNVGLNLSWDPVKKETK